jgi:hypothetical protein
MIKIPESWTHEETMRHLLKEILVNQELQMSAIDDLNKNITELQGNVGTLLGGVTPNAAVEAAAASVATINATVVAAIPPAPAPAPAA